MRVLAEVNLKQILSDHIRYGSSSELIELYHLLDEACESIEEDLISMGVWEPDE